MKDAPVKELAVAIRRTMAGERVVDPGLAATALSEGGSPLLEREREVLVAGRWRRRPGRGGARPPPLRGHGAQPPERRDPEASGAEPGRSGPDRRGERLALALRPPVPTDPEVERERGDQNQDQQAARDGGQEGHGALPPRRRGGRDCGGGRRIAAEAEDRSGDGGGLAVVLSRLLGPGDCRVVKAVDRVGARQL